MLIEDFELLDDSYCAAIMGFGVYLFVMFEKSSSSDIAPTSANMVQLGRPMLMAVSLSSSFWDSLPKAWFIYLFIGVGVVLFVISCFDCIGATTRNGCCLTCYAVTGSKVDSLLLLFQQRQRGSRREDDWTCPSCGNVKFSFRTTRNMRNCTQSRPVDYNSKSAAKPIQPMRVYLSSAPYVGFGAPSSMYMGVPPYGSSLFNGSSMSPNDVPFSGGSAYPYNYGSCLSGGSPYRPLHMACPTPYSSGSMMGNEHKMPYGSWKCEKCNNINYPFRTKCNRQNCGAIKPSEGQKSPSEPADENDQVRILVLDEAIASVDSPTDNLIQKII
ncbi:RanBP2-type zinc finger protein [Camellia lanceoleosa]|uniref:RanBP2-type zinc finger protein n=1 Tax=Camellia lanceoleosa TaxID=1840588 RepID=A0ACC0IB01_9ERIC|nr:RanBP2-type zinc finger protein [Camellia lanceoleosa]